jgi:hypothetical protein
MAEYTHMSLDVGQLVASHRGRLGSVPSQSVWNLGEQSGIDRGSTQSTISITILTLLLTHFKSPMTDATDSVQYTLSHGSLIFQHVYYDMALSDTRVQV